MRDWVREEVGRDVIAVKWRHARVQRRSRRKCCDKVRSKSSAKEKEHYDNQLQIDNLSLH